MSRKYFTSPYYLCVKLWNQLGVHVQIAVNVREFVKFVQKSRYEGILVRMS